MEQRHGLSIGMERVGNEFLMTMKATGKLHHADYEIITPMIESALQGVTHPHIRAFVDCLELDGWDAHAAWDDFRLGMRYQGDFERIALVGRNGWQEWAAKVGGWFLPGEVRFFEDADAAWAWLRESAS